jgi:hypothetical protein
MNWLDRGVLITQVARVAAFVMSLSLAAFGGLSASTIGPERSNVGLIVLASIQMLALYARSNIVLRVSGLEFFFLALLQLPLYFAPSEGGSEWQVAPEFRTGLFAVGVVLLSFAGGVCFEAARLIKKGRHLDVC